MKTAICILLFAIISGCSTLPPEVLTEEAQKERAEKRRKETTRQDTDSFRSCQIDRCY